MGLGKRYDYEKHRGDAYDLSGTIVDRAGDPIDISAAATTDLIWNFAPLDPDQEFPSPLSAAILSPQKSIGLGVTIIDDGTEPLRGQFTITIVAADTTGETPGPYYHEAQYTSPSSVPSTVVYGILTLREDLLAPGP